MDTYEQDRLRELRHWQTEPPPPVARWFSKASNPKTRAVQSMVPAEALRSALNLVLNAAQRSAREQSLLKQAGVAHLSELSQAPLEACDRLASGVRNRAMVMAGGTGAVLGVAGAAGLVADVPTLLVMAFRTIHRVGLCYGESLSAAQSKQLSLAIFALASANSVEEKQAALAAFRSPLDHDHSDAAWRDGVERAAEREFAKEAAKLSLNNLAMQAGKHLGWRKAASMVPFVGAVIGGSVNAWYLYDTATVARYCFQERWLTRRYDALPKSLPAPKPKAAAKPRARRKPAADKGTTKGDSKASV